MNQVMQIFLENMQFTASGNQVSSADQISISVWNAFELKIVIPNLGE